MLKIKKSIVNTKPISYANATAPNKELLDLGEGYNPYGFDPALLKDIDWQDPSLWAYYPRHERALQEAVAQWWKEAVSLDTSQIRFIAGSIEGIYKTFSLFDADAGTVLGIQPQFSETVTHAKLLGFSYRGIPLRKEENFHLPLDALCDAIDDGTALVYLDHPHNPTGQTVPLEKMRAILEKAQKFGACVISDEAYGDYIPKGESAAVLLPEFENLIVLRSFSKGWGMAGVRAGYMLTGEMLSSAIQCIGHPYAIPGPFGQFLTRALGSDIWLNRSLEKIARTKAKLIEHLGDRFQMAPTHPSVVICMLTANDPAIHLGEALTVQGIRTIYGESFYGLDHTSVRLRIPHERDEERLWNALKRL